MKREVISSSDKINLSSLLRGPAGPPGAPVSKNPTKDTVIFLIKVQGSSKSFSAAIEYCQ